MAAVQPVVIGCADAAGDVPARLSLVPEPQFD